VSRWFAPVLHLRVGRSTVRAAALHSEVVVWAGEATYDSTEDLAEVVARLAAEPTERCRRLQVTLERPPVQTRTLTDLPPVRDRELSALVANQAGRFFRRNGAPLVTDAVWVSNGTGRVAHAAAVEEQLLLAIVAGATQAGLRLERIAPADVGPHLQLLPTVERAARKRANRRLLARFAAATLLVWLVAAVLFGLRIAMERRAIDQELAAASAPLAALHGVRREMRSAEAMVRTVAESRASRGRAVATLARLNAALPDSAVITSYTWRADGSGVLAGSARHAANVVAAVERARALPTPRLEGAVMRETIAGRDWERFTILFGGGRP